MELWLVKFHVQEALEISVEQQLGFDGNYGNDDNEGVTYIGWTAATPTSDNIMFFLLTS